MNFLSFLTSGISLLSHQLQDFKSIHRAQISHDVKDNVEATSKEGFRKVEVQQTLNQPQNNLLVNGNEYLEDFIIEKQQDFIQQYLQMNIQLFKSNQQLSKIKQQKIQEQTGKEFPKKIKKITKCGHTDKQHYAKGMCNNCYHKFGRNKKPWNCSHDKLYAAGMCQNCYINQYNRKKRDQKDKPVGQFL